MIYSVLCIISGTYLMVWVIFVPHFLSTVFSISPGSTPTASRKCKRLALLLLQWNTLSDENVFEFDFIYFI